MKVSLILTALISCAIFIRIAGKSPILIVPGLMGSQLRADVQNQHLCLGTNNLVWFNIAKILCAKVLKLHFNQQTRVFQRITNVRVKNPMIGDTNAVECIVFSLFNQNICLGKYLNDFIAHFTHKDNGEYVKGQEITAAPYDWRLSPYELRSQGYFDKVKARIVTMFNRYDGKPITIVAHSYGGVVMLYFLRNEVDQKWKDKYIKAFIPLGSPFGGATKIVGALAYGIMPIDLGIESIETFVKNNFLPVIRTFPSLYFLAPRPDVFQNKVLVKRGNRSYTAKNYMKILTYPRGLRMYQATHDHNGHYIPGDPGVPTYCMYGTRKATPDSYEERRYHKPVEKKDTRGDGTVDSVSLEVCRNWPTTEVTTFPDVDHMQIVMDKAVLNVIGNIVLS